MEIVSAHLQFRGDTLKGAILAGGAASRFGGEPKGLHKVGGERMLDRTVRSLEAAVGEKPLLVANTDDAGEWIEGMSVVKDVRPDCGSLGGIYTVVVTSSEPTLIVAWDMPFVSLQLLQSLAQGADGYDVFLPESRGPLRVEPLCAVYGPGCADPIEAALDKRDLRTTSFHEHVRVGILPLAEVERCGDPKLMFFNVNTPDDVTRAEELWRNQPA